MNISIKAFEIKGMDQVNASPRWSKISGFGVKLY